MEWDKIYAINRNYIDPIAKRYFAVSVEGAVNLLIDNMEDKVEEVEVDWHQKNKELGKRIQKRYNKLVIEKEDANLLKEGQKLTLYKWGNTIVEKIEKEGENYIFYKDLSQEIYKGEESIIEANKKIFIGKDQN